MGKAFDKIMTGLREIRDYQDGKLNLRSTKISIEPVSHWNAQDVLALRQELNISQSLFAIVLGVSKKTVEAWESGKNVPNGSASRVMEIISKDKEILARQKIFSRPNPFNPQ